MELSGEWMMIRSISCDKESFKSIEFKPGFNVILAERTKEATSRDSRNGLGKSTLIEIIHFCLGGDKGETLSKSQLDNWTFTMEFDLRDRVIAATRNTKDSNKIWIEGDTSSWPLKPTIDKKTGKLLLTVKAWKETLGTLMFEVQPIYDEFKYIPTFRSLISYFVRRNGRRGGFLTPFQQNKSQSEWDRQVNNAFLLGLGWEFASRWQKLKDKKKLIEQIGREANTGLLTEFMGSLGQLESTKIRLTDQVNKERTHLDNFRVHPQYAQLEAELNDITRIMHKNVNFNLSDGKLLESYEDSLRSEVDANPDKIKSVYEEVGLILPNDVQKRLEDVLTFHKQIVLNRRIFLAAEIEGIKRTISERLRENENLDTKKSELMLVLKTHGALEEWTQLQTLHQLTISQLKDVTNRIDNLKMLEQGKSAINIELELLFQQAKADLGDRNKQKEKAVLTFNNFSNVLYSAPGNLSVDVSKTGFKFDVKIERSGSQGIGNMEIFCYDLTLARLWAQKRKGLYFVVHDSSLFADVDERQKALALLLSRQEAENMSYQYICLLNSDALPIRDLPASFNLHEHVILTLTDETEDGGLLGIRF